MKIVYRDQRWELQGRWRVEDAIREVDLVPQRVFAVCDGKLLTGDMIVDEDEEIRLVAVISGG
jgi:sulfur carrier protein ThiS